MIKKDYILIAEVLKRARNKANTTTSVVEINELIADFNNELVDRFDNFSSSKFINYIFND